MLYGNIDDFNKIAENVEDNSIVIENIVNGIIEPYIKDLDNYVEVIRNKLKDGNRLPTTQELDSFCLNLSTYIYVASSMAEKLGIRDDISKAVYKEVYNNHRNSLKQGTVVDKNTTAELNSQHEQLTSICYSRAYKLVKTKVDNAQELLGSCKKVLSHRITEMELTRISNQ